ncbi:MAG: metal ABC transporter ATP-binding protein [Cyclobacteriaceae bacterium]
MIKQVEHPVLEVHDLTVSYNKKPVLWSVDFTIPKGVLACVVGPNGAGKSTLIKGVMDLVEKSSGYAKLFDMPLDAVRKRISYVPQRESVDWDFPASVLDIVLMGRYAHLGLLKRPTKKDKEIAFRSLEEVGMQDYHTRQISQLSGGQQQRVFLARALAQEADLYLMDEPFVGIDATTEKSIVALLTKMKEQGKTVIIVHHDLQSAMSYFDWAILLNTRLVASGPMDEVFTSELLQETYGGKLSVLSQVGDLLKEKEYPTRKG